MRFLPYHGRFDPDQEMGDWGFQGPEIKGVHALVVTYNSIYRLVFDSEEACEQAREQTGFEKWEAKQLEIRFHEDLVHLKPHGEGPEAYYGDWEVGFRPDYSDVTPDNHE